MAPSAGAVVVVANTHCTSFGIQNVCAMAFGVHPGIHDFFRRNAAPCGILASSGIRHAVLAENSVPLGTIGTNVRIDGCDLFGAPLSSCGELCIAHDQGLQAVLCTLGIDQIQNFLTVVAGVRVFGAREDQHPVVVVNAAFVVAHTHGGHIRIQHALTCEINVHPLIHRCIGGRNASYVVFANGRIVDTILGEDGKIALAIGTNVGIRRGQFLSALLSGTIVVAVAQLNGLQASLCALIVYAAQELVLISFVLKADVGIFFFDGGRTRSLAAFAVTGLRDAAPKTTARVIAAAAIFFRVRISSFIRHPP